MNMKMSDIKEALIDHAKTIGRPPYEICVAKALYLDFRSNRDNPLKAVVIDYLQPENIPLPAKVELVCRVKNKESLKRIVEQKSLLLKYRKKHGRGCWVKLINETGGISSPEHISNVASGRSSFSKEKWELIKAVLLKDLKVIA